MTTPPHNPEAERAVIGAMMWRRDIIDVVTRILHGDEFYVPRHTDVFHAAIGLHSASQPVDPITVAEELRTRGVNDERLLADLTDMVADVPGSAAVSRYARIVADKYKLRQVMAVAAELGTEAAGGQTDASEIIDRAEQAIFAISDRVRVNGGAVHLGDTLGAWVDAVPGRRDRPSGVPTGWVDLDRLLTGLRPGQLIVVAGRPGMGKSAFLGNLVVHVAKLGEPTLLVSAEMALEEIQDRFVASESRVNLQNIRSGQIGDRDFQKLGVAMSAFVEMPLYVQEAPSATLMSIRAEARRVAAKASRISLVVIDYLQLLKPVGKFENRQTEVAQLARGLKEMALELHVPVVAAAQLNRQLENRADKRPTLADLRESGELENAADVVMFPYRDDYYNPDSRDAGVCEVHVAKHRNGPVDTVKLAWRGETGRLENMAVV